MFTTFFKMSGQPFAERMPTADIMSDERMSQGLARLQYMAQYATVAMLTGEEGVGKSTLLKLFIHWLSQNHYHSVYLHLTNLKDSGVLRLLVSSLGERPARGKEKTFLQVLAKTKDKDLPTVALIDEAHLLSPEALVDLRLLVSGAMDERPGLKIVLSGHPNLKKELKRSCHNALRQRIVVNYSLAAFTQSQTHHYINYHLKKVGSSVKIFDDQVKTSIHDYARGVPRIINNIATTCLINAAVSNVQQITPELLCQSLDEIQCL
jgi:general secretion pathway protein A